MTHEGEIPQKTSPFGPEDVKREMTKSVGVPKAEKPAAMRKEAVPKPSVQDMGMMEGPMGMGGLDDNPASSLVESIKDQQNPENIDMKTDLNFQQITALAKIRMFGIFLHPEFYDHTTGNPINISGRTEDVPPLIRAEAILIDYFKRINVSNRRASRKENVDMVKAIGGRYFAEGDPAFGGQSQGGGNAFGRMFGGGR